MVQVGNIQVEKMIGSVLIRRSSIVGEGNIKVEDNFIPPGEFLAVDFNNVVAQNLQVFKNTGAGPKNVSTNTAGESIQCFENNPPFFGGPNTAPKKEGQCF
jgi:hypothetical protein